MAKKKGAQGSRAKRYSNVENGRFNHYNYSSMAYDYAIEEQEEERRQVIRRKRKRGTKKQLKYVHASHSAKNLAVSTYLTIIAVFVCAFICLLSISNINAQQRQNLLLNNELKAMTDKTNELQIEVSQTMDLEQIEYIARTKLQMSEPEAHQIYYISVPKQNYTVLYPTNTYEDVITEMDNSALSLSSLKKLFSKE